MKKYWAQTQPVPVFAVTEATEQFEKQGWKVRFVLFAGLMQVSNIALAGHAPPAMPGYVLVAEMEGDEKNPPKPPTLKLGDRK